MRGGGRKPTLRESLQTSADAQDFYRRINAEGHTRIAVTCPECSHRFTADLAGGRLGES